MKMAVSWVVAPCSSAEVNRRFRGAFCLYHQGDVKSGLSFYKNMTFTFHDTALALLVTGVTNYEGSVASSACDLMLI
jgi:hypothetical protein